MPTATHPQSTDELYAALRDNDARPYGRPRTVTAEELVDAAEQFDDTTALVRALFDLQEAYTYGSEPRKSPVVFARLLNLFDEQPDVFDERMRHLLFWRFKWVAGALRALPEVPLSGLRQWQREMRDRYEKAGLGLQPCYGQAYQLAVHLGEDTTRAYELWAGRARTRLSDCEACEICERALFHLAAGDDGRALTAWDPVLDGKQSCQEEPARSVSYALLPLLRTGHADRARELHLAGYRACRRNPAMAPEVGRHLEFCALTGNEARGLELLAENRALFDEVESPRDLLDFLTGVQVLLRRVEHLGHGQLPAAGWAGRTWTVAALCAEAATRADDLAARFDARNGTTAHTDRRRARLDRTPLLDSLELALRTRALDDLAAPGAPAPTAAAGPSRGAAPLPASVPELIRRARALDLEGHPDAAACWARLRTLVAAPGYTHPDDPELGPFVRLCAELLDDEAGLARDRDEPETAFGLYEEAAGLYEDAGEPGDAAVARACALLSATELPPAPPEGTEPGPGPDARGDASRPEQDEAESRAAALTAAHAAVVRLHEETSPLTPQQEARLLRVRASVLGMRLQVSGRKEHVAPAAAEAELLHEFAVRHGLLGQAAGALILRAGTHALSGDLPTAAAGLDALQQRLTEHGPAWYLPRTLALRGRVRRGLQDPHAAYADQSEALRLAADWPDSFAATARLHADAADTCLHLGRPGDALRHLTRSAEIDLRAGSRMDAFCAYGNAAQLSLDLGRIEDAIALLDSLLTEPDAVAGQLDDRLLAQLRLTRARALHAGSDLKAATAEFLALSAESSGWDDDPGSHAMIAAETAVLLAEAGEFDRARQAVEQAVAAHGRAPRYEQLSNALREIARLRAQQQGPEGLPGAREHLAVAARIADEAREAGYTARGRSLDTALAYEHGRVNAHAGQYEEALVALDRGMGLIGDPGEDTDLAGEWTECVRLAGAVEGIYLERTAAALSRLDTAARRLTELGHTEESEELASLAQRLRDQG
ncbi:hypothetical protein [Streptomyces sp. t39]|uniref:hypothetical protein n=1 Tax=Streptomyces sp. t39 TaxID=1828156 RepID=UPI0011CD4F6F|nr:hypothetical protein [Streptomyces sp. t39]TXS52267.1 hypothetical protein EAO77_20925 [Streptomyces sp. t39]